jgi:uncharacterized membrane protein YphA (DoxX/SURF4 family)
MVSQINQREMADSRQRGIPVGYSLVVSPAAMALVAIPIQVTWSYGVGGVVFAIGLVAIFLRGEWRMEPKLDKLILFGPLFYAVPIAAFGTEHFTITRDIASIVPAWIPWHVFWTYLVGTCFIAAAFSLVTRIRVRLSASLLAVTFFLFVVLMDIPAYMHDPHNRFGITLTLRELSFCGGPLALAANLSQQQHPRGAQFAATIARYFIAIPVLFYCIEQFLHADHVPGIPLEMVTPTWLFGHAIWTYVAAVMYAIAGIPLLAGRKTRAAAAWIGLTVLFLILVVYVPIGVKEIDSLEALNYLFDTLMYGGTVLLLAGAMPRSERNTGDSDGGGPTGGYGCSGT